MNKGKSEWEVSQGSWEESGRVGQWRTLMPGASSEFLDWCLAQTLLCTWL